MSLFYKLKRYILYCCQYSIHRKCHGQGKSSHTYLCTYVLHTFSVLFIKRTGRGHAQQSIQHQILLLYSPLSCFPQRKQIYQDSSLAGIDLSRNVMKVTEFEATPIPQHQNTYCLSGILWGENGDLKRSGNFRMKIFIFLP